MTRFSRLLIFLAFLIGVVFILMLTFGRSNTPNDKLVKATRVFSTVDYLDTDSHLVTTISGPIVGDDRHNEVRITVTPNSRTIDVIQGYQDKVINSKTYPNNRNAYKEFLYALNIQKYGKAKKTIQSENGACATGRRYSFDFYNSDQLISNTWSGSCSTGDTLGDPSASLSLFKKQITDYDKMTNSLNL